jgi:hypothetical protein
MSRKAMTWRSAFLCLFLTPFCLEAQTNVKSSPQGGCRSVQLTGEVRAGQGYAEPINGELQFVLQPIHSGWILRVMPRRAHVEPDADYAEVATPPYRSVTPLSLSTDFSFRAQDAVGWNPREFRFALDSESYRGLLGIERATNLKHGTNFSPALASSQSSELGRLLAETGAGRLRILDAGLIAGTADQWAGAGAVASHFSSTAHTLERPADDKPTALGALRWVRFEVDMRIPTKAFEAKRSLCDF